MKETIDGAARAWNVWESFWTKVAMLGLIGLGVFIYIGNDEIRSDLPQHQMVGIGIAVAGTIFFLSMVSGGSFGVRLKRLSLVLCFGGLAGLFGFGAWRQGRIVYGLEQEGVVRTMTVQSSTMDFASKSGGWKIVLADGPRRVTMKSDSSLPRGTEKTLLVHPDHASWTAEAGEDWTLMEIAEARGTRNGIIGFAAGAVLLALLAVYFLLSALFGRVTAEDLED